MSAAAVGARARAEAEPVALFEAALAGGAAASTALLTTLLLLFSLL